jgi:hypothetical protein
VVIGSAEPCAVGAFNPYAIGIISGQSNFAPLRVSSLSL